MASKGTRRPFEDSDDESDEDSIATDTTDAGDLQEEYEVEKILDEMLSSEDHKMRYLVKWAGYPLGDASWEPLTRRENASLLDEWEQQKAAIAEGRAKAFNIDLFTDAAGQLHAERVAKKQRRQVKRDKRKARAAAKARQKAAQSQNTSVSTRPAVGEQVSSANRAKERQPNPQSSQTADAPGSQSPKEPVAVQQSKSLTPSSVGRSGQRATTSTAESRVQGSNPPRKVSSGTGPRFLQTVYRAQKYAAREPPPDPEKLVALDPKTGRPLGQISAHAAAGKPGPPEVTSLDKQANVSTVTPDAAGRDFDTDRRRRSISPSRRALPSRLDSATSVGDRNFGQASRFATETGSRRRTCRDWAENRCNNDAKSCPNDHFWANSSMMPTKAITCHFWRTVGACTHTSQSCDYAHVDTGHYARPPGTAGYGVSDKSTIARERQFVPKHEQTCWYWLQKIGCSNPWCKFAHRDTGIHAPPPPSFRNGIRPNTVALDGGRRDSHDPQIGSRTPGVGSGEEGRSPLWTQKSPSNTQIGRSSSGHTAAPDKRSSDYVHPDLSHLEKPRIDRQTQSNGPSSRIYAHESAHGSTGQVIPPGNREVAADTAMSIDVFLQIHWMEGDQPSRFPLCLEFMGPQTAASVSLTSPTSLRVQHAVMVGDFQAFLWKNRGSSTSAGGGFVRIATQHRGHVESIVEYCKSTSSGLLAQSEKQTSWVVLYPADAEEWKFFAEHDQSGPQSDRTLLRFVILADIPQLKGLDRVHGVGKDADAAAPDVIVGTEVLALDEERMLNRDDNKRIDAVFLILPATRHIELQLYSNFFLHLGCKVYHSGLPGAWDYFCKRYGKSCLVMIHTGIQLEQIPGLHDFIAQYGNGARIFSIGVDPLSARIHDEPPSFDCVRLFPYGQVYLLTDEALVEHAAEVTEIVKLMTRYRSRPLSHSKIVTRPQVKQWLLDQLAQRQDAQLLSLYSAIDTLCPLEDEDPNEPGQPLATSGLVTMETTALSKLAQLDADACSDYLVNWFAGWAVEHASIWRTFVVCHAPPKGSSRMVLSADGQMELTDDDDPQGWRRKYNHVGLRTPQQLVEELRAKK